MSRREGYECLEIPRSWIDGRALEDLVREEYVKLFPGVDFSREVEWMEVRRMFGGGLMAVGMD